MSEIRTAFADLCADMRKTHQTTRRWIILGMLACNLINWVLAYTLLPRLLGR